MSFFSGTSISRAFTHFFTHLDTAIIGGAISGAATRVVTYIVIDENTRQLHPDLERELVQISLLVGNILGVQYSAQIRQGIRQGIEAGNGAIRDRFNIDVLSFLRRGPSSSVFAVDLQELNTSPIQALRRLEETVRRRGNHFPRIAYSGTEALDVGGLTRDFVTRLVTKLCETDSTWPMLRDPEGDLPYFKEDCSRALGMICAYAMLDHQSMKIGTHFHPAYYALLYGLTNEEMTQLSNSDLQIAQDIPQPIYNKMLKTLLKARFPYFLVSSTERNQLDQVVDNFVDQNQVPNYLKTGGYDTKDEFMKDQKIDELLLGIASTAKGIQSNLGSSGRSWNETKGSSPEELRNKIEGPPLTREQAIAAFGLNRENLTLQEGLLKQWLQNASLEKIRDLIWAASGSTTIHGQLEVRGTSVGLPAFHTCSKTIDIRQYDTFDAFSQDLEESINQARAGAMGLV